MQQNVPPSPNSFGEGSVIADRQALKAIVGSEVVTLFPALGKIGGSLTAGIMLSQAVYWTEVDADSEGWFQRTEAQWQKATTMTISEQEGARAKLVAKGLLEIDRRGIPARLHYRLCWDAIVTAVAALRPSDSGSAETAEQVPHGTSSTKTVEQVRPKTQNWSSENRGTIYSFERKPNRETHTESASVAAASPPTGPGPPVEAPAGDNRAFSDCAAVLFEKRYGQKPTWTRADYVQLTAMRKANPSLSLAEFARRFENYLYSADPFHEKQGGSLRYFCSRPDSFIGRSNDRTLNKAQERSRSNARAIEYAIARSEARDRQAPVRAG
jgi:hypothetical protein